MVISINEDWREAHNTDAYRWLNSTEKLPDELRDYEQTLNDRMISSG